MSFPHMGQERCLSVCPLSNSNCPLSNSNCPLSNTICPLSNFITFEKAALLGHRSNSNGPLSNSNCLQPASNGRPRRRLSKSSLRRSSGFSLLLKRPPSWVIVLTRTAHFRTRTVYNQLPRAVSAHLSSLRRSSGFSLLSNSNGPLSNSNSNGPLSNSNTNGPLSNSNSNGHRSNSNGPCFESNIHKHGSKRIKMLMTTMANRPGLRSTSAAFGL